MGYPSQCPRGDERIVRMRVNLGRDQDNSLGGDRVEKLEKALKEIMSHAYYGVRAGVPELHLMEIIQMVDDVL